METRYYDEYSRIEREHWWFQARQSILGQLLDRTVGRGRPLRILDLGCGTGESVRHLSNWGRVIGLDFSPQALEYCRRGSLDRLVQGDALRLPFADASFDLVCALDLLEHLPADQPALVEIQRVCRPGGHVLLMVPALPMLWSEHDELNHHLRRYRRGEMKSLVTSAGLVPSVLTYFNTLLFPPVLATRLVRRWLRRFAPARPAVSDFSYSGSGPLAPIVRRLFSLEGRLVGRIPLPIGVSLVCLARRAASAAQECPPVTAATTLPCLQHAQVFHDVADVVTC